MALSCGPGCGSDCRACQAQLQMTEKSSRTANAHQLLPFGASSRGDSSWAPDPFANTLFGRPRSHKSSPQPMTEGTDNNTPTGLETSNGPPPRNVGRDKAPEAGVEKGK